MRNSRRLIVLAATMAFGAPSAVAHVPTLEVVNEATGAHCPFIQPAAHDDSGGCVVHVTSVAPVEFRTHVAGVEGHVAICDHEFTMRIDEFAEGELTDQVLSNNAGHPNGCTVEPCNEEGSGGAKEGWSFTASEVASSATLTTVLCITPIGSHSETTCEITMPVDLTDHQYELGQAGEMAGHGPVGTRCELVGQWVTELGGGGDQSIEISHTDIGFINEASGQHCPAVTTSSHGASGGCRVHIASTGGGIAIRQHIFGVESVVATCDWEMNARLDEDASGYLVDQILSGAMCNREPCNEEPAGSKDPWQADGFEGTSHAGFSEEMNVHLCLNAINSHTESACEIDIPFRETATSHILEFGEPGGVEMPGIGTAGFRCEIIGHWLSETGGAGDESIEVGHG